MPIFNAPFSTSVFAKPEWITGQTASMQENNTTVATLAAARVGSFSVVGGADANKFSISGSTLSFATAPDFENPTDADGNNVYVVTVRATNAVGFADQTISITVTDDTLDNFTITTSAHGSSTVHDMDQSGDSFTLTASGTTATTAPFSSSSAPKLYTMTPSGSMTVDVEVRGAKGGGSGGGRGGLITGRLSLTANTTYYLVLGAKGVEATSNNHGPGGYGGGGSGGGDGTANGTPFGNGGVSNTGSPSYSSGDIGDGGGGLSGIFSGSPSQATAIIIAGGGGGMGVTNGGAGGGGTTVVLSGTDGSDHVFADGGSGGTTSSGGAGGSGQGGTNGNSGSAGRGGGGAWDEDSSDGTADEEGGGGGGGGYYGGGGGGANADQGDAGGGGGGSGYYSSAVSNVSGSRGSNTGQGSIKITRV